MILIIDKEVALAGSLTSFEVSVVNGIITVKVLGSFTMRQVLMELPLIVLLAEFVVTTKLNIAFVSKDSHASKLLISLSSFSFFHSVGKHSFV